VEVLVLRNEDGIIYKDLRMGVLITSRNGYLARITNLDHGKLNRSNEVFAPRWTSLRASGGVIYLGGNQGVGTLGIYAFSRS